MTVLFWCAATANFPVVAAEALPDSLFKQLETKQQSLPNALQLGSCKVAVTPVRTVTPWSDSEKSFWLSVADPGLISWLTLAKERSPNVATSILSLNRSFAMHEQTAARQGIRTNFGLNGSRNLGKAGDGSVSANNQWSIQSNTSYELDVWGKKKRDLEQSQLNLRASQIDAQFLLLNLDVSVAQAYWQIQLFQAQHRVHLSVLQDMQLQLQDQQLLMQLGLVTKQDLASAELALAQQKMAMLASEALMAKAKLQTAVDLGVPSECLKDPTEIATQPVALDTPKMSASQPAELLLRRADLQAAEIMWRLAKLQLMGAKNAFLPTVGFSFSLSDSQNLLSKLLHSAVLGITAGFNIAFDPLEYRSQIDLSDIALQTQEIAYRTAVHKAIHQVVDVQQTAKNIERDEVLSATELALRQHELDSAQLRLNIGISTVLPVRQAQQNMRQAHLRSVTVQDAKRNNLLRMYLALGGPPLFTK